MTDAGSAGEDLDQVDDRAGESTDDRGSDPVTNRVPDLAPYPAPYPAQNHPVERNLDNPGPDQNVVGGQSQNRPDGRTDNRTDHRVGHQVGHQVGYSARYPVEGRTSGPSGDAPAPWQAEPDRAIHRGWPLVAMVVIVLLVGAAFVALMVGGNDPVDRADPTRISAPVTLPASVPPAPKPSAQPPAIQPGDGAGDLCPGSDSVSADDQPGWGHETVQGSDAACGGRFSVHTTSEAGGVFYRWTTEPVPAGSCGVAVYIPDTDRANETRVSYSVLDGDRLVEGFVIAQANHHGEFVAAGTYPVNGGQPVTVQMSTQSATPGTVVASAVRVTCHQP